MLCATFPSQFHANYSENIFLCCGFLSSILTDHDVTKKLIEQLCKVTWSPGMPNIEVIKADGRDSIDKHSSQYTTPIFHKTIGLTSHCFHIVLG